MQLLLHLAHERVQKHCLKLLYPSFSYTKTLSKSGRDHLDYRRDLITQNIFREMKGAKHCLHYLLLPVKMSLSEMVLRPMYPYQLSLGKLLITAEISFCTVFPRYFKSYQ